ncbi:hypothetical protein Q3G72_007275 [Acer saccharum]|nr:hypothetical protein Q3G72_007275 [Acer saccharum]
MDSWRYEEENAVGMFGFDEDAGTQIPTQIQSLVEGSGTVMVSEYKPVPDVDYLQLKKWRRLPPPPSPDNNQSLRRQRSSSWSGDGGGRSLLHFRDEIMRFRRLDHIVMNCEVAILIVFQHCRRKPAMSTSPEKVDYPLAIVAGDDGGHCQRQQWWQ